MAWIKRREGRQLDGRVRLQGDRDFLKQLELALQYGFPFMVAGLDEWLDPVLDPLLEKAVSVQVHARRLTRIPLPMGKVHARVCKDFVDMEKHLEVHLCAVWRYHQANREHSPRGYMAGPTASCCETHGAECGRCRAVRPTLAPVRQTSFMQHKPGGRMRPATQAGGRRVVRVGDKEVDWDSGFRLYLVTHLASPAFGPEVGGKTTLINFSVTEQARGSRSEHADPAPPLGPPCGLRVRCLHGPAVRWFCRNPEPEAAVQVRGCPGHRGPGCSSHCLHRAA